ncbi:DedA family protein [Rummeliibacillus pycnus]|uniref:DedA family protein n=1 Tax=Rummeliibacillus pycnus TaxID=101070 RepID=UPI003D2CDC29
MSNFDDNLARFLELYGGFFYIVLFLMVYLKTAFIVLTFIPGDSLVFASGALAAIGELEPWILLILFFCATVVGDSQNYSIGAFVRRWKHNKRRLNILSEEKLNSALTFIDHYSHISIVMARFIPLMRTTVPFVSGYTHYRYSEFLKFNSIGAILWVFFWLNLGYILGSIEWIENNLTISLVVFSIIPLIISIVFMILNKVYKAIKKNNIDERSS